MRLSSRWTFIEKYAYAAFLLTLGGVLFVTAGPGVRWFGLPVLLIGVFFAKRSLCFCDQLVFRENRFYLTLTFKRLSFDCSQLVEVGPMSIGRPPRLSLVFVDFGTGTSCRFRVQFPSWPVCRPREIETLLREIAAKNRRSIWEGNQGPA